jgi:hypothetical protein
MITDMAVAGDALLAELTSNQPHLLSIRSIARTLKRAIGWIGAQTAWLTKTSLTGVTLGVGKKIGEDNADTILHHLTNLAMNLTNIIGSIVHLFTSLSLPF